MRPLLLFVLAALPLSAQTPQLKTAADADRIETYRSIDGYDLRLWIYEPEDHTAGDKTPAVVFFFGDGWNGGTPTQFSPHSRYLASRGMVAMVADYRVKSRQGVQAKECVVDAKAAMRWIRTHADDLGIDPRRLAAGGGSVGGHLAAAVATQPERDGAESDHSISPVPDALALFNPATILASAPGFDPGTDLPSTIIFHGREDTTVSFNTAEGFCDKARELGARCELVGYDDAGHGFFNHGRGDSSHYKDTVRRMDAFFASLGWLSGAPTIAPSE